MRVTETVTETREVEVLRSVKCNQCGEEVEEYGFGNFLCISYVGGYASILGDGTERKFDLYEPCLKVIMAGFKIPPIINYGSFDGPDEST